jgi:hypothetical protein
MGPTRTGHIAHRRGGRARARRRELPARVLLTLAVLLLAACNGAGDGSDRASERNAAPVGPSPTPSPTVDVASWDGAELPPAIGGMTRQGDLGIYFAEVDHRYTLVAIDITTGKERWRRRAHQLGRIGGTVPSPVVDWERGLVFAPRFEPDGDPPLLGLFAYDLDGRERWRAGGIGEAHLVYLCADDWSCASLPDGTVQRFLRDSGATVFASSGGVGRVIGGPEPWLTTANADRRLVEQGRIRADGSYRRRWRHSFAELFGGKRAGATYTPNGGWYSHRDETGATVVLFGTRIGGDQPDPADLREEAELGLAASLVGDDGEVRGSWQRVDNCMLDEAWRDDAFLLCEDLEVVEDGRVIDGEPAPWYHASRVASYRFADGRRQWTAALPGSVETIMPTSDESVALVQPNGADPLLLDFDDGSSVALGERPELIVACERDYDPDDIHGELDFSQEERREYLRATEEALFALCDASGNVVDPADLLGTGELTPEWFGLHPDLEDGEEREGADRWAVWVTPDGTLHGAGPADEARNTAARPPSSG